MRTSRVTPRATSRIKVGALLTAATLALAACGGAAESDEVDSTEELNSEAEAAQQIVDDVVQPVTDFEAPGPALENIEELAGETIYFVPFTFNVPMFVEMGDAFEEVFANVDVNVEICNGNGNPSDMATCLNQAVDEDAAGVIVGGIPYDLAPNAFDNVLDAEIPLLYQQTSPDGPGDLDKVSYLTPNNVRLQSWLANWIIADSNAQADVLVLKNMDTPATQLWIDEGTVQVLEEDCAECNVQVVEFTPSQLDKLSSDVTAQLTSNPDIKYVQAGYDVAVQPTVQGIQGAGRTSDDISVLSVDGTLGVVQMLAEDNFVKASVGFNKEALAWHASDQLLRMMTGQDSTRQEEFAYARLFEQDSAQSFDLTPEGEASGEWYGDVTYREGFLDLWGAS